MKRLDLLKTSLSDLILFHGNAGISRSGLIRVEINDQYPDALLSFAVPHAAPLLVHLGVAASNIFVYSLMPNFARKETFLMEGFKKFTEGHEGVIRGSNEEGDVRLALNREALVYELSVKLKFK